MKKIYLRIIAIIIITFFFACRQEIDTITTEQKVRETEFFKTNLEKLSEEQKQILHYLDNENSKTNFISRLNDRKGIPIWDKMIIKTDKKTESLSKSNSEEETYIIIPVAKDEDELSSVIYAKKVNGSFDFNNITNSSLRSFVFDTTIPISMREEVLIAYLFADHYVYGTQNYVRLPNDLLPKYIKKGKLSMKSQTTSGRTVAEHSDGYPNTSNFAVPMMECLLLSDSNKCNCPSSWGHCDMCGSCTSVFCSIIWVESGGGSGSSGGSGTGGDGGGGEGGGTGDGGGSECSSGGWYKIIPGGCNPEPPEEPTPCEYIPTKNTKAKEFIEKTKAAGRKAEITATLSTDTQEKGFSYGVDSSGNEQVTGVKTGIGGNAVDVDVSSSSFFVVGAAHTHTPSVYNVPSAGDVYNFFTARAANSKFSFYNTFAQDNNDYVFVIADQTKFDTFITTYPKATYFDPATASWKEGTSIGNEFKYIKDQQIKVGKSDDEAYDLAMAFVLNKYGTGIAMSKKDASGNYQPVFVKENLISINTGGIMVFVKTYEQTTECNY